MFQLRLPWPRVLSAVVLFVPAIAAQRLIGGAAPAAGAPLLATQSFCAPSVRLCSPILAVPPTAFAGGTAYDPIHQVVWDTDGIQLVGVQATSVPACQPYCTAFPAPVPAGSLATGLACDESRNALWLLDSSPGLSLLRMGTTTRCPTLTSHCSLAGVIPATHQPGGLAFSERRQLVVWSSSVFSGGAAANIVYLAPAATPCTPTCRITLFGTVGCGASLLGPITGLAYDDGTDQIYATDGTRVMRATYVPACGALNFQCCGAAVVAPWYGLCLEPEHPAPVGQPCLEPACGTCGSLALGTLGDPSLGNPAFALRVGGAPVGAVAVPVLHPGGCAVGIPFLCGLYHPAALPPALILPPVGLAGTAACGGSATVALPIPMDPALSGAEFCTQAVIVCLPAGTGLTNAVRLKIVDT